MRYCLYTFLGALCILALSLRLYGIRQDLPAATYPDETLTIYTALKFGTGDFNPHNFINPPLYHYLLFALLALRYVVGLALHWFSSAEDYIINYLSDPTAFFLIGRGLSVLFGMATLPIVLMLGRKIFCRRAGILALCFFACAPLHVQNCHYAIVDVSMLFFFCLSLLWIVDIGIHRNRSTYLISGIFAGLACATKYNAAILLIPMLVMHFLTPRERRVALGPVLWLFTAAGIFILTSPYTLLDGRTFVRDLYHLHTFSKVGWFGWEKRPHAFLLFWGTILFKGIGPPIYVLALIGIYMGLQRRSPADVALLSLITVYSIIMGRANVNAAYGRFMLPLVPLLVLYAAYALSAIIDALSAKLGHERFLLQGTVVLCLIPSILLSFNISHTLAQPSTLTLAGKWVENHITAGARILIEYDSIPLKRDEESVMRLIARKTSQRKLFRYREVSNLFFKAQLKVAQRSVTSYDLETIPHPIGYMEKEGGYAEEWMTVDLAREMMELRRYDYIVVDKNRIDKYIGKNNFNNVPERYRFMQDFYASLPTHAILIHTIAHAARGPEILIYKVISAERTSRILTP